MTAKRLMFEGKNEKRVQMDEYAEIFITSNSDTPLYIASEDRRQVILKVSPVWKNKKKLSYIDFGENGYQVRDCLHPWDLSNLIRKIHLMRKTINAIPHNKVNTPLYWCNFAATHRNP